MDSSLVVVLRRHSFLVFCDYRDAILWSRLLMLSSGDISSVRDISGLLWLSRRHPLVASLVVVASPLSGATLVHLSISPRISRISRDETCR